MTQTAHPAVVPEWTLADRLRKARETAGLHSFELADEIGIARNTVSNYENGRTKPRTIVLRAWALRTGVDLNWLLRGETDRPSMPAGEGAGRAATTLRDTDTEWEAGRDTHRDAAAA